MSFDFTTLRNVGTTTAKQLQAMGIKDDQEMKKIGTEELFFRHFQTQGGWKKNMCSCWLYAIEGAITETTWNLIPYQRKQELKKYFHDLRDSFKQ